MRYFYKQGREEKEISVITIYDPPNVYDNSFPTAAIEFYSLILEVIVFRKTMSKFTFIVCIKTGLQRIISYNNSCAVKT